MLSERRVAAAHWFLLLVGIVAMLTTCAIEPAHAQSTRLGRGVFSAFDVFWERQEARYPWLRQLDNTPEKTWLWHGAITEAGGYALSKATPLSFRRGRQVMAGFYVIRELYGILAEGNRNYRDATGDALVPVLVALSAVRIEVRF